MNHRFERLSLLVTLVLVGVMLVPMSASAKRPYADTVFKNGYIYTVDLDHPLAQAVAVTDGKVRFVGPDAAIKAFIGPNTQVVDLQGKMMMPGLEDGHTHLQGFVACNMNYEGGTEDYVLAKIKAALLRDDQVGMLQSNYVLNCSYFSGTSMLPPGTYLTSHMLDRLSLPTSSGDPMATGTTRPIVVSDLDGHKKWVNSQAMLNAGITSQTPTPPGSTIGHYDNGEPNGFFADFSANWGLTPPSLPNSNYVGKLTSIQLYNQKGTTSIEKASGSLNDLPIWKQMADNGDLTMRVNSQVSTSWVHGATEPVFVQGKIDQMNAARAQYSGYTSPNSPGSLTVDTVKVFADGVVEYPAQTAAMLEPYNINIGTEENPIWVPGPSNGPVHTVDDAVLGFLMLDANHWTIHVHAIGNRAVRDTLNNYELINNTNPLWDRRDQMVHVQFVDPADMPRFGQLGVVPDMQLQWAEKDSYTIDALQPYVSPEVYNTMYPARSLEEFGAVLAGGSDFPVDALDPWREIEQAVTRAGRPDVVAGIYEGVLNPSECLTLPDALRMHTMGTAYQLHQDNVTGSISVGKFADLIVVNQNLFNIPPSQIRDTQVLMTMVGGNVVWEDPVNPL